MNKMKQIFGKFKNWFNNLSNDQKWIFGLVVAFGLTIGWHCPASFFFVVLFAWVISKSKD